MSDEHVGFDYDAPDTRLELLKGLEEMISVLEQNPENHVGTLNIDLYMAQLIYADLKFAYQAFPQGLIRPKGRHLN